METAALLINKEAAVNYLNKVIIITIIMVVSFQVLVNLTKCMYIESFHRF